MFNPNPAIAAKAGNRARTATKKDAKLLRTVDSISALINDGDYAAAKRKAAEFLSKNRKSSLPWQALGRIHLDLNENTEALHALDRANSLQPDNAATLINLSLANFRNSRFSDAAAAARKAAMLAPEDPLAHNALGIALEKLGDHAGAADAFRQAITCKPDFAQAISNFASTLNSLGHPDDALEVASQALKIDNKNPDTLINAGNSLLTLGRPEDALSMYSAALTINPGSANAGLAISRILRDYNQPRKAAEILANVLRLNPRSARAHAALGEIYKSFGRHDDARTAINLALDIDPTLRTAQAAKISGMAGDPDIGPEAYLHEVRKYSSMLDEVRQRRFEQHQNPETGHLRIGFIGGDFKSHPVSYFIRELFDNYDNSKLSFYIYYNNHIVDSHTEFFQQKSSEFRVVYGHSDQRIAQAIHDDGINILIDLSGYTKNTKLTCFPLKPAPVQMTWIGYYASTGIEEMDYILCDPFVLPETEESHFTERPLRFRKSYLCFSEPNVDISVAPLPALTSKSITFGSFNNITKINDDVISLWSRVLLSVGQSRLFLKSVNLGIDQIRARIIEKFGEFGVTGDRLIIEGPSPREDVLRSYNKVDIALDPFPYCGGTTSMEALWMGVPVLTRQGDRFLSRIGESIVTNAGLPDWIAADDDDYIAKANQFAADPAALNDLRLGLRQQVLASPIFNGRQFAGDFEALMQQAWRASTSKSGAQSQ